ncbi:MAG: hypothetical protein FJZ87_10700, partial [Chloroflexi bacterium]|nr:hypothetical protein [Chloroflexota bacterium]
MHASLNTDSKNNLILRLATIWRWIFMLFAVCGTAILWMPVSPVDVFWQKVLFTIVLAVFAILSGLAATFIPRRDHRGRTISLLLDYLAFVAAFVFTLNVGQVFIGIDSLGEKFGAGLLFLGVTLVGYLIGTLGKVATRFLLSEKTLQIISRFTMLAGLVLFLWRVDAVTGLVSLIGRLTRPAGLLALSSVVIFGLAFWIMWREPSAVAMGAKTHHEQVING